MRFHIDQVTNLAALANMVFTSVLETLYECSQSQTLRGLPHKAT